MSTRDAEKAAKALVALGERLFEAMERLDPCCDPSAQPRTWVTLTARERQFYVLSARAVLEDEDLVSAAFPLPDDEIFATE